MKETVRPVKDNVSAFVASIVIHLFISKRVAKGSGLKIAQKISNFFLSTIKNNFHTTLKGSLANLKKHYVMKKTVNIVEKYLKIMCFSLFIHFKLDNF